MDAHRRAELRSLALHRAVAERLIVDPTIVARARARLSARPMHPRYRQAWLAVLSAEPREIASAITRDDEHMRALRQCTPFTFVISPRDRWRIWREVS